MITEYYYWVSGMGEAARDFPLASSFAAGIKGCLANEKIGYTEKCGNPWRNPIHIYVSLQGDKSIR